jgi:hypothetical protein
MKEINWNEFKCRSSALGCLFTEPQKKEDKLAGKLSATAKGYLAKAYIEELWGKRKEVTTKQMDKGILCEPAAISMLSDLDGVLYQKNEVRETNNWITGHADIITDDEIFDVKCSWDSETFIKNLTEPVNKDYDYQLQGYMSLYNRPKARIRYCLCSMPLDMLKKELERLLWSMNVATSDSPEYIEAAAELNFNLTYDEIPIEHRVIDIIIPRNEEIIAQIPEKVEKAREYLKELHQKHMNLNLKPQLV